MRKSHAFRAAAVAGVGALALIAAGTSPASAADTTTTFTLAGGALNIAVQPTAALTNGSSGATSISGQLGNVTVTDGRGDLVATWVASGSTGGFADGSNTTTSSGVNYSAGIVSTTGVIIPVALPTSLTSTPTAVVNGTLGLGNNTASWNPTLTVTLPSSSVAGNYSGMVTTSVA